MNRQPITICGDNLSTAWLSTCAQVLGKQESHALTVSITTPTGGQDVEDLSIRTRLDDLLKAGGQSECSTVASTIFPTSLWNRERSPEALFERYLRLYPRLRASDSRNINGMYFHRMIAFGQENRNQLKYVIDSWHSGLRRRSAFQVAIMDPMVDQTNQRRRGFPCLQHVIFTPHGEVGLSVTGIYGTQYLIEKAYGNYLGLYNLGLFMANALNLQLSNVTCFAAIALLSGKVRIRDFRSTFSETGDRFLSRQ